MQKFYYGINNFKNILQELNTSKFLLVCDSSFSFLNIKDEIESTGIPFVKFDEFDSNPLHDDVDKGRAIFEKEKIDVIVAVGGGSSIDVAKCIKLDSGRETIIIAIPTTAGTGSESTKHIVVYRNGKKESLGIADNIPDVVIFESKVLKTLPVFQKKCTMLDALCQGIESYWSINANNESRKLSAEAITLIIENMNKYIEENDEIAAANIMKASNYAGQAINITQTTAAHAMSYKITSMYRIPHGGAVAICLPQVWRKMTNANDSNLNIIFNEIASFMKFEKTLDAIEWFENMIVKYEMPFPVAVDYNKELSILVNSVNTTRLKNNPIQFTSEELKDMYARILR